MRNADGDGVASYLGTCGGWQPATNTKSAKLSNTTKTKGRLEPSEEPKKSRLPTFVAGWCPTQLNLRTQQSLTSGVEISSLASV